MALRVKISIFVAHCFHFSFCATPNRCSSSTTKRPSFLNCICLLNRAWVPIKISTCPSCTALMISFFSLAERNRFNTSTRTPNCENRYMNVLKCCSDNTVVGTSIATCFPLMTALNIARIATSVLPNPTSPHNNLSIGRGDSIDSLISWMACNWSSVSSYGNWSSNSRCHG